MGKKTTSQCRKMESVWEWQRKYNEKCMTTLFLSVTVTKCSMYYQTLLLPHRTICKIIYLHTHLLFSITYNPALASATWFPFIWYSKIINRIADSTFLVFFLFIISHKNHLLLEMRSMKRKPKDYRFENVLWSLIYPFTNCRYFWYNQKSNKDFLHERKGFSDN